MNAQHFGAAALSFLLAFYIRLVRYSTRFTVRRPDIPEAFWRDNQPFICATWHGQNLLLPTFWHNWREIYSVTSLHGDGEIVARLLTRFGFGIIRGSGVPKGSGEKGKQKQKKKGGAAALRNMLRVLEQDISIGMTADMPPGPARRAGEGIIALARLSGRPIVPIAGTTRRRIILGNWDRFQINLPFSKGALVWGEPVYVPGDATVHELEDYRIRLENALNAVTHEADTLAGHTAGKGVCDTPRSSPEQQTGAHTSSHTTGLHRAWMYRTYRLATRTLGPLLPLILNRRMARGKEEPGRLQERKGVPSTDRPCGPLMWLHAASLGEATSVLALIDTLSRTRHDLTILVTSGTVTSAHMMAQRLPPGAIHQYVPVDHPSCVTSFLSHWKPDLAVFVESELWPNLLAETTARKIPLTLINARLSEKSFRRWQYAGNPGRNLIQLFDVIAAQDARTAGRLRTLGARHVMETGNLKFDANPLPVDPVARKNMVERIADRPCWTAASTHAPEEQAVALAHQIAARRHPGLLTFLIPRHPARGPEIYTQLENTGLRVQLRSKNPVLLAQTDIYIADTMGELGLFYDLAPLAFVGGSLTRAGGHNPVEPAQLGCAVLWGPHMENAAEPATALHEAGAALRVHDGTDLGRQVAELFSQPSRMQAMEKAARETALTSRGTVDRLSGLLLAQLEGALHA